MASSQSVFLKIALPYRIFFLYIEPVLALGGSYFSVADPERLLLGIVPLPAFIMESPLTITPIMQLLLTNIGALYVLFAMNEAIVLRCTREKSVWVAIIAGLLVSDFGHLYAAYAIAPERALQLVNWSSDEWINVRLFFTEIRIFCCRVSGAELLRWALATAMLLSQLSNSEASIKLSVIGCTNLLGSTELWWEEH